MTQHIVRLKSLLRPSFAVYASIIVVFLFIASCSDKSSPIPTDNGLRGRIVEVQELVRRSRGEVQQTIQWAGLPQAATSGVIVYRVIYQTIDAHGANVVASGTVAIPDAITGPLPIISVQHGTETERYGFSIPSANPFNLENDVAGGTGYIVVQADYLGFGVSDVRHPYLHAATQASACLDLLRAAKKMIQDRNIRLSNKLFLMGYSQGGHATAALHRAIEEEARNEFSLTASVAAAGPYDVENTIMRYINSDERYFYPAFMGLLALGFADIYPDIPPIEEIFHPTVAPLIKDLFDGTRGFFEANDPLPQFASQLLAPEFIEAIKSSPDHSFRKRMRENNVYDWTPRAPLAFYHCEGDEAVEVRNAIVAHETMQRRGGNVSISLFPGGDHESCFLPVAFFAKMYFDGLR